MDYKTICSSGVHITSAIGMKRLMMDMEEVNSDDKTEDIEDKDKHQKHYLAEQQQKIIDKHQQKLVEKHQHQKLAEKQAQGLSVMGGLANLHVLYGNYYGGINKTKTENSQ